MTRSLTWKHERRAIFHARRSNSDSSIVFTACRRGEIVEAKLECVAILDPKIAQLSSQGSSNERGETDSVINADSTVAELITALREQDRPTTSLAFHSADSKEPRV